MGAPYIYDISRLRVKHQAVTRSVERSHSGEADGRP